MKLWQATTNNQVQTKISRWRHLEDDFNVAKKMNGNLQFNAQFNVQAFLETSLKKIIHATVLRRDGIYVRNQAVGIEEFTNMDK